MKDDAAAAAAARTDVVHASVPSVPSVPLSFTTRHDHGDAVRTGGRRWRRPSPTATHGVTIITEAPALSGCGDVAPSCGGMRLDKALEAQSTEDGRGGEGGEQE